MTSVRREAEPQVKVEISVQTNGVGLDDFYLGLFGDLGVQIGMSVDGRRKTTIGTAGSQWTRQLPGGCRRTSPPELLPVPEFL